MRHTIQLVILFGVLALAGCSAGGSGDWKKLREQANDLYNNQQFKEALGMYESALDCADADGRLTLRQDIIDCHLAMGEPAEARKLLGNLIREAHDSGNGYAEAEATFALGEQLHESGDKAKGYAYMLEAAARMQQVADKFADAADDEAQTHSEAEACLAYYHHVLMKRYGDDEDYPQAISHSKALEQTVMARGDDPQALKFRRTALAIRAYLYMRTDSIVAAEQAYREWQQLLPCLNVGEERDICPYYMESGRYREALSIYRRYEAYVLDTKGRWSNMERLVCRNVADIYSQMGQADSAYSRMMQAYEIKDTLQARQAEANAQELEAVYQNQLKTEQISRLRLWVIILGGVLAVLVVVILIVSIRRLRERKNQAIVSIARNMAEDSWQQDNAEAARFAAFDRTVEQGRLYTQSDLSREMLADLMGVDRTTFSRIIQEQSGCKNMNDYLNQKRIRHAAQLLREQPNHTVQAVMEDSGFQSKSNFIRLFRETYGMTPSEYRKGGA